MESYNPKEIESKWQKYWAEHPELYSAREDSDKPKKYILDMFPYPSGEGLHVGHVESYTATDIVSRYFRMNGFNVLHPQGWDAFGLPAENYAIKTGTHPTITTQRNIANFTRQIKSLGMSYDWLRKINTSDTEYYKWTQWFFLLLYKNGLAYKKKGKVNWCPSCQTVLAHEQVEDGVCERCKNEVVQKDLEQWYFKITDFIEKNNNTSGLLEGLEKVDWPESIKLAQRNWIGRSEGVQFKFRVIPASEPESKEILNQIQNDNYIEVFTTRLDTVFGVTYVVVAPENPILESLKEKISNWDEVEKYIFESKKKSDLDRMEEKEKTGVEIKGVKAINPFNGEEVPIFVGDYVLGHYGTGAVMAVPAHDERDFEFARKYNLLIKKAIDARRSYVVTIKESLGGKFYDEVKKFSQLTEKDGLIRIFTEEIDRVFDLAEKYFIGAPWYIHSEGLIKKILFHGESGNNRFEWEKDFEAAYNHGLNIGIKNEQLDWKSPYEATTEDGILVDSGEFSGLSSEEAREKMIRWLEEKEIGKRRVNYKLRDWLVSRQRYWGAPIPIIYCEKCGMQPVPESDLPVVLPDDVDFKPTGESPLVYSKKFHDVKCPTCGGSARRESDTMDTFVCSSWYYFRYSDPKNDQEFASREKIVKWLPVDTYVGGAEHAVLHLLYARFFTKVLHNLGIIDFDEPFLKLRNQGLILAEDGRKMSKSLGNVVNPDQVVEEFGADSLRMFEMFMGPLEDAKPWQTQGIVGTKRFLEKVYRLSNKVRMESESGANKKLESLLHKTIKKVSEDIENFRFNTAISSLMILTNEMEKEEKLPVASYELLIALLSPFAPHIAEELWNKLGRAESIFREKWPRYDPELIKEEEIELVVQISGKMRAKIKTKADISEDEAKELALSSGRVKSFLDGREIKKIIFVQGKLINIVV